MPYSKEEHKAASAKIPRDSHGHFAPSKKDPSGTLTDILQKEIKIEKTNDDNTLVDVHVNNPLKRILFMLEELKKQKAFTFSIKGSLGVAGIVLLITAFGIFGGGKALCEKGVQTAAGRVQVLAVTEEYSDPGLSWWDNLIKSIFPAEKTVVNRVVLFPQNSSPIHLVTKFVAKLFSLNGQNVIATGTYDACSATLTIQDEAGIERQF